MRSSMARRSLGEGGRGSALELNTWKVERARGHDPKQCAALSLVRQLKG